MKRRGRAGATCKVTIDGGPRETVRARGGVSGPIIERFRQVWGQNSPGFGIIEAMIAIFMLSAITVVTVNTLRSETSNSNANRSEIVATGLAKQAIAQAEIEINADSPTTFPEPFVLNYSNPACNPAPTSQACMPGISNGYNDPYTSTAARVEVNGGQTGANSQKIPFTVTTEAYWQCPTNIQSGNVVPIFMVVVSVTAPTLTHFDAVQQSTSFAAPGTINTALLGLDTGYQCF